MGEWIVAGTGYTGEDGVEIHVPAEHAADVWDAIVAAGITPAGLGARDTLRLEAGLPLHGHELGPGITPLQAGLGWVVRWDKGDFRGRDAARGRARAGSGPPPARASRSRAAGPRATARRVLLDGAEIGDGHQRQLLADARSRDRARVRCGPTSSPAPRAARRARPAARRPGREAPVRPALTALEWEQFLDSGAGYARIDAERMFTFQMPEGGSRPNRPGACCGRRWTTTKR